jgi:hypothetical protein
MLEAMPRSPKRAPKRTAAPRKQTKSAKRRRTLQGSCQCGAVTFSVASETPVPFLFCFCSICRKTGGGAFGCNIMGLRATLKLEGKRSLRFYHARIRERGKPTRLSEGKRWFCKQCGSHLYLTDERWPAGIWPYVAAIDSDLPAPTAPIAMMTAFKPSWVPALPSLRTKYPRYPKLSIAAWHEREGWPVTVEP